MSGQFTESKNSVRGKQSKRGSLFGAWGIIFFAHGLGEEITSGSSRRERKLVSERFVIKLSETVFSPTVKTGRFSGSIPSQMSEWTANNQEYQVSSQKTYKWTSSNNAQKHTAFPQDAFVSSQTYPWSHEVRRSHFESSLDWSLWRPHDFTKNSQLHVPILNSIKVYFNKTNSNQTWSTRAKPAERGRYLDFVSR